MQEIYKILHNSIKSQDKNQIYICLVLINLTISGKMLSHAKNQ